VGAKERAMAAMAVMGRYGKYWYFLKKNRFYKKRRSCTIA
jgi:hypothetical protein